MPYEKRKRKLYSGVHGAERIGRSRKRVEHIGAHNFNMRALRSRPMKNLKWNYYFYIEAEGNVNTQNGKELMQELSALCAKLKLVGSYFSDEEYEK